MNHDTYEAITACLEHIATNLESLIEKLVAANEREFARTARALLDGVRDMQDEVNETSVTD